MKLFLVEDDLKIADIIIRYAKSRGYAIEHVTTGYDAEDGIYDSAVDLYLLDVMLPDTDGWTILKEIKSYHDKPVILLTARSEIDDKLLGFDIGADDYVTKPFNIQELFARISVQLKKNQPEKLEEGTLSVDISKHQVFTMQGEIQLSKNEYELLVYLMKNKGITLSREQILTHVWGVDYFGDDRTVDTHIVRLRRKLGSEGGYIQTVRGYGYKLSHE